MSAFDDARSGTLVGDRLNSHIAREPNLITQQENNSGWTLLSTAVVAGFPEVVRALLDKGAKADQLSQNGETPLLLACWRTVKERRLITQLILEKTSPEFVDTTCGVASWKTPLMFAIERKDLDSINLLRTAKASLTIKNSDGFSARELAEYTEDPAVVLALNPKKEKTVLQKLSGVVNGFLGFVVAWGKKAFTAVTDRLSWFKPELDQGIYKAVEAPEEPTKDEFVETIDNFVQDNPTLDRFFGNKKDFIKGVAQKVANLEQDPTTDLGKADVLPKTVKVSLHQQVIYCDDSTSMKRQDRWENQKKLIRRIAKITTLVLPEGEGVAIRFINRAVDESSTLSLEDIGKLMEPMTWQPGGDTPIGTGLKAKILEPMVYRKIATGQLERPLLVSIMTDGMPEPEDKSTLANAIIECGVRLENAGYPLDSVKFMIGQIGTAPAATEFLKTLQNNEAIAKVAFVTSDKLDEMFSGFHDNERQLDRWLIETLWTPLREAK